MRRLLLSACVAAFFTNPAYGQTLEGASRQYSKSCDNAYKGKPEDTVIICDYWTNNTGIIETVVQEDDGRTFVDAIFLRGRKLQQGQRARESSRLGLPPKV